MQNAKPDDIIKGGDDNELSQRGKKKDTLNFEDSVIKKVDEESDDDDEEEEDAESLQKMFNVDAEDLH